MGFVVLIFVFFLETTQPKYGGGKKKKLLLLLWLCHCLAIFSGPKYITYYWKVGLTGNADHFLPLDCVTIMNTLFTILCVKKNQYSWMFCWGCFFTRQESLTTGSTCVPQVSHNSPHLNQAHQHFLQLAGECFHFSFSHMLSPCVLTAALYIAHVHVVLQ